MNRQTLTNGGNGLKLRMIIQRILDQADQRTDHRPTRWFILVLITHAINVLLAPPKFCDVNMTNDNQ